jgi:uncharacterized protein YgfB (UPF0149 family)
MHPNVAYADVARALAAAASAVPAAEAHGCLCGALCLRPDYSLTEWLEEILAEPAAGEATNEPFATLFEESLGVLARPDMEFEPLLPDDDAGLAERVSALAAWCQGFLYGFGASGAAAQSKLPETVTEVLGDLAQLSHAGAVGSEDAEVEEEAYAELVEFVRAAVQIVYEELGVARAGVPAPQSGH